MTDPRINTQGSVQPGGSYAQPSPGLVEQVETLADMAGRSLATIVPAGFAAGTALLETAPYRDQAVTAQAGATAAAPTGGTVVATVTPAAGVWEISGTVAVTGTTVAAADSNNMQLKQGSTVKLTAIPLPVNGTSGSPTAAPFGPLVLSLDGATAVTVNAVGAATGSSIYSAQIIARRIG